MSKYRRHAEDFTDSLNSFQNTKPNIDCNTLQSISGDSLEETEGRSNHRFKTKAHTSKHSTILAGNSASVSVVQDTFNSSVTPHLLNHYKQDLNKRINLRESEDSNEHFQCNVDSTDSYAKSDDDKDNSKFESVLCSLDNEFNSMKEMSQPQQVLKRLFNEYVDSPKNFTDRLLTIIEESTVNNENCTCGNASAINLSRLTTEFRKMCRFIENESPPQWPESMMFSPEKSVKSPVHNNNNSNNTNKNETLASFKNTCLPSTPVSGIDIIKRRLFQKMLKDSFKRTNDTVPNFSMNEFSDTSFERLEAQCKKLYPEEKECVKSLHKSLSVPSLVSQNQIKDICEKQMASLSNSIDNINSSFDSGCAIDCSWARSRPELNQKSKLSQNDKISYSKTKSMKTNEKSDSEKVQANKMMNDYATFDTDELEKTLMQDIAEKRRRCLDTARLIAEINADPDAIEAKKSLGMSPSLDNEQHSLSNNEATFLRTLMSCKHYQTYLEKQEPFLNLLQKPNSSFTERITLEDDEKNNVQCGEVQDSENKTNGKQPPSIRSIVLNPNVKLYNTPKTPLLEKNRDTRKWEDGKYKFKYLVSPAKTPRLRDSEKNIRSGKKSSSIRGAALSSTARPCNIPKTSLAERNGNKQKLEDERFKSKFFATPGKTPPLNNCKKKKIYFPSMHSPLKNAQDNIIKSPHAEGLYRLNYNTIVSPVGMYIKGTDPKLIKNVHAKRDDLLLTPRKKTPNTTPNKNSKQDTLLKGVTKTNENMCLKEYLSPNVRANEAYNAEVNTVGTPENTPKSHFKLPKVSYQLPLQIKTLKENEPPKSGTRVKKLIESARSKVVIRHQGRTNVGQKRECTKMASSDDISEINYEPQDESVHIEQTAARTNFIHKAKYI